MLHCLEWHSSRFHSVAWFSHCLFLICMKTYVIIFNDRCLFGWLVARSWQNPWYWIILGHYQSEGIFQAWPGDSLYWAVLVHTISNDLYQGHSDVQKGQKQSFIFSVTSDLIDLKLWMSVTYRDRLAHVSQFIRLLVTSDVSKQREIINIFLDCNNH